MNNIKLRAVSDGDAQFLTLIMNTDSVLNALNELPTQLEDWVGLNSDKELIYLSTVS